MMEDVVGCKTMETGRTKRGGVPGYLKDKAMRGWSPERRVGGPADRRQRKGCSLKEAVRNKMVWWVMSSAGDVWGVGSRWVGGLEVGYGRRFGGLGGWRERAAAAPETATGMGCRGVTYLT